MTDKRKLVIHKGEEFKLSVRDKIERTDIFYDQYLAAAKMLDDIVHSQEGGRREKQFDSWCRTEYENNIIAFCGERGEGKSSAMISFVKAAYNQGKNNSVMFFADCENVKDTYFAEPIVIDPSMLDGIHNVLDIVLAALYRKFKDQYEEDNQSFYTDKREKLLDQFQKVYKCVSLINNRDKMLDDEYDYEGNISKLSKLGQSTALKDELEKLVVMYLEVMMKVQRVDKDKKMAALLIAIDDLDLCSSHAYKMAEQIRKYLILPQVVITMAVKIEQLELCVQEKNLRKYRKAVQVSTYQKEIIAEITNMSERYVAKLIPKARRNYLPHVRQMSEVEIAYMDKSGTNLLEGYKGGSVHDVILYLIYKKTGMKFLLDQSGENYFLPDNLRDMVNLVTLLTEMGDPQEDNSIYYDNILKFSDYFEKQWLSANLSLQACREIQNLMYAQLQLHESVAYLLNERFTLTKKKNITMPAPFLAETNDSFLVAMNWLEVYRTSVFGKQESKYAYMFRILYTIRLNKLLRSEEYNKLTEFIGGYVWGWNFQNVLPHVQGVGMDRSRFRMSSFRAFNVIAAQLYPGREIFLPESVKSQYYIREIKETDEDIKYKIISWILLGILSNTYIQNPSYQTIFTFNSGTIVSANHALAADLHISLENYIVSLCNLQSIYEKVNMEYLGISRQIFQSVVDELQQSNQQLIEIFRRIAANVDIAMELIAYCKDKKNIKESGSDKSEAERTEEAANIFFRNAETFVREHLGLEPVKLNLLTLGYDSGRTEINISLLYASLLQACIEENAGILTNTGDLARRKEELVKEFASTLRERTEEPVHWRQSVSTFLKNITAQNAKRNMDSLAWNVQQYYSKHKEETLEESKITDLCSFYGKVLDVYLVNETGEISEELRNEYKQIVGRYQKECQL